MVLILKDLRKKPFSSQMTQQTGLCRLFVKLERNHIIRFQCSLKLSGHNDRISAIRTRRGCHALISDNLSTTGLTLVGAKTIRLTLSPFLSCIRVPYHFVRLLLIQCLVISLKRLHLKLCVAKRTFHLLDRAVKVDRATTARALIFLYISHTVISFPFFSPNPLKGTAALRQHILQINGENPLFLT